MTETPQQLDEPTRAGVNTENLRNYERLRRSTTDRKIAGVAGGLGRHLNIDPTVLRVLFVVLVFFGGAGLVLYGAAWLLVPKEGSDESIIQASPSTRNALLIVVGVLAAILLIGDSFGGFGFPWPLAIIAVVLLVVLMNRDRPDRPAAGSPPESQPAAGSPETATYAEGGEPPADTIAWQTPAPYQPPPKPDRGPRLFGPTLALVALALGILGLIDTTASIAPAAYPALALAVIGAMLVVGSMAGRPGGLILIGVIAALALAVTTTIDDEWSGDRRVVATPRLASELPDGFTLTAGQIQLDLSNIQDVENLDGRRITLKAEAGEILVTVPDDVDVDVDASIRYAGEANIAGAVQSGNQIDMFQQIDGGDDVPKIFLDLDLAVGVIQVEQENAS